MQKKFMSLEGGRSMIEMLGVLAIIGVLTVGAIAMYAAAMSKYKTNVAIEQIQAFFTEIHDLYTAQGHYNGISLTVLQNAQVLPDGLEDGTNGWGGTVTVAPNGTSGTEEFFVVTYNGLPQEVCVKMATKDWNDDLQGITLTSGGELVPPVGVASATTNCSQDGNTNTVALRFI